LLFKRPLARFMLFLAAPNSRQTKPGRTP
jgi:hypothetical protein